MSNPWLSIPLADYEGHMNAPQVEQLGALSDLFADALAFRRPMSVAVLGIAGGNGLDRIDLTVTTRILGIDLNPTYLDAVRRRYPNLDSLDLRSIDLAERVVDFEPVQLVHAALIFEHTGTNLCLENAVGFVAPGGALSVVLQLPSTTDENVSPTAYASMQNLKPQFALVDPATFCEKLESRKFQLIHEARRPLPSGKAFWLGIFTYV